jgi:hypothetical protein
MDDGFHVLEGKNGTYRGVSIYDKLSRPAELYVSDIYGEFDDFGQNHLIEFESIPILNGLYSE